MLQLLMTVTTHAIRNVTSAVIQERQQRVHHRQRSDGRQAAGCGEHQGCGVCERPCNTPLGADGHGGADGAGGDHSGGSNGAPPQAQERYACQTLWAHLSCHRRGLITGCSGHAMVGTRTHCMPDMFLIREHQMKGFKKQKGTSVWG